MQGHQETVLAQQSSCREGRNVLSRPMWCGANSNSWWWLVWQKARTLTAGQTGVQYATVQRATVSGYLW